MEKNKKIIIAVATSLIIVGVGYIAYNYIRIAMLNKKVSTPEEVDAAIKRVSEENPNAEIIVSPEEVKAVEEGKFKSGDDNLVPTPDYESEEDNTDFENY